MDPLDVPSSAPRMSPSDAARLAEGGGNLKQEQKTENILEHKAKDLVPPTLTELPGKPLVLEPEGVVTPSATIGLVTAPTATVTPPPVGAPVAVSIPPLDTAALTPQTWNGHSDETETATPNKETVGIPLGAVALCAAIITVVAAIFLHLNLRDTKVAASISAGLAIISLVIAIASFKKTRYPNVLGLIGLVLATATLAFAVVTLVSLYYAESKPNQAYSKLDSSNLSH